MSIPVPASPYLTPISLATYANADRAALGSTFAPPDLFGYGAQTIQGIAFDLGQPGLPNVILLDQEPISLDLGELRASYLIFLHAVEDRVTNYLDGLADFATDGNLIGPHVADYQIEFTDGESVTVPIRRRFAIQQSHIGWGASPFEAIPAMANQVFNTATEQMILGQLPVRGYGRGETRHETLRNHPQGQLWLYALPNPRPDRPIRRLQLIPGAERTAIYGLAATQLTDHPLQPGVRRKVRITLPDGVAINRLGEVEEIAIDLGTVISARAALEYDVDRWLGDDPNVQPVRSEAAVIVEYAAHPQAQIFVGSGDQQRVYALSQPADDVIEVAPAHRPVRLRIVEKETGQPVAVRLHLHGAAGEYLPPRNHHRKVNGYWFEDNYGEFVNRFNQYSYVDGDVDVDLPLGPIYIEITRGYEVKPLRTVFEVNAETEEVLFELERVLHWRKEGWVTADTHVHFLSPQTALLEGQAEGVNVVNLLASQWGEMFSNVTDFDGKTTIGAREFGGDGEFLVRVGTENRMQVLGHISLLGYSGRMINPLCTGGASESAIGDPQEVIMAEWAQRCIDQGGLVVMPHGPNPQGERAADIVLGLIHAQEMMTFNPYDAQINPYGVADWYRFLNLGYNVPICGGSDKMAASSLLGGVRTYTHLGERDFTYENWMAATKAGNTFVTVGPLAELRVEGQMPGSQIHLPASGGMVDVSWKVESTSLPVDAVEIVVGGLTLAEALCDGMLSAAGNTQIRVDRSTWIALRVRGSYRGNAGDIAAHTSAVQVIVGDAPIFSEADAGVILEQIEGTLAYLDTLAPRSQITRIRQMRSILEGAYNRLHQRMHRNGVFHQHAAPADHHQ
ncbi:MAG: CehA/McbA family metallohydrolase [Caldilineaceae bacterium]|nr:CehA/McbA family metallohydrolase [Caldilineaceae bacterium]